MSTFVIAFAVSIVAAILIIEIVDLFDNSGGTCTFNSHTN